MTFWLALIALLFSAGCADEAGDVEASRPIAADELVVLIEAGRAPLILDVRSRDEFAAGHIPGAVNIPHDELSERLDELDIQASEEIVVHCQSGRRAGAAEALLADAGYLELRDLTGHWLAWQGAGHPVE